MIRTEDKKYGVVISPKNQLFETRLKLVRLSEIRSSFTAHSDFKQKIRNEINSDGLLNPIVVDKDLNLKSGTHRIHALRKECDSMLAYVAESEDEVKFFSFLGTTIWKNNINVDPDDLGFIFNNLEPRLTKMAERCPHLFNGKTKTAKKKPVKKKKIVKKKKKVASGKES
jgi:hypothetical protein